MWKDVAALAAWPTSCSSKAHTSHQSQLQCSFIQCWWDGLARLGYFVVNIFFLFPFLFFSFISFFLFRKKVDWCVKVFKIINFITWIYDISTVNSLLTWLFVVVFTHIQKLTCAIVKKKKKKRNAKINLFFFGETINHFHNI